MAKGALGEGTFGLRWCPPRAVRVGQYKSVISKRGAFVPKMRSSLPKEALSVTVSQRCHLSYVPTQSHRRGKGKAFSLNWIYRVKAE